MNKTIRGSEMITSALYRARIVTSEIKKPMSVDKTIDIGFLSAKNRAQYSACFLEEEEADNLEKYMYNGSMHNITNIIFIMGNSICTKSMHKILAFDLPFFLATDVKRLESLIFDACIYSELTKKPSVVYVEKRILDSRRTVERFAYKDFFDYSKLRGENLQNKKEEIESKYLSCVGKGETVILANGICYQYVRTMIKPSSVRIVNVEMLNPNHLIEFSDSTTYIGVGTLASYFSQFHKEGYAILPTGNDLFLGREIYNALKNVLREDCETLIPIEGNKYEPLYIKRPLAPENNSDMCPGCEYRRKFVDTLERNDVKAEEVFVDVYCKRLECQVYTGHKTCMDYQRAKLIFTNTKKKKYDHKRVVLFSFICKRKNTKEHTVVIDTNLCNGCNICTDSMRCPAIYSKGIKMFIDSSKCNACGWCIVLCKRHAIKEV